MSDTKAGEPVWRTELTTESMDPIDDDTAVVVGYDGSPQSDGAVRWAAAQADRTGGRLDLVTTWEYPTSWGNSLPLPSNYDPAHDAEVMLDPVLNRLHTDYPSLDVHAHVVEGHAGEVLVVASEHAGLLVVGSRGHRALAGVVIGSVSLHCVTMAACPVVVYREFKDKD
jgi:nucleotide-binding universal stress UspA family protein